MSYTIGWLESASNGLRRLRTTDPDDVRALTTSVGSLATDPRPDTAHELGTSGLCRMRVGDLRAVYEVDDDRQAIYILTVGRLYRR